MNTQDTTAIHNRAILVWLTITTWAARKYDKHATATVHSEYKADSKSGRYTKQLIDAPEYKALITLANTIRAWHYSNTLAWADEGWRLLPIANYDAFTSGLRTHHGTWDNAKGVLVPAYPSLVQNMRATLNGLWRESDYPKSSDIADRFSITVQYSPVPAEGDIRVDLASDQIAAIQATITDRVSVATATAMQDAWQRLYETVSHIRERLQDPTAIFRDSLHYNATAISDSLQRLNITNDPNLESMRQRVAAELTQHTPEMLRINRHARQDTADKAQAIMDAMSGFYGSN